MRASMLAAGLFFLVDVHSAGIPTVDAGVIAQQIRSYQQQLRDFETQLRQAGINTEQLITLNKQFSQALREYNDYLQQVRGLHRVISRQDWEGLFQVLKYQYGVSAYSRIPGMNAGGTTGRQQIDAQVSAMYTVPAEAGEVRRQIEAIGADPGPWLIDAERRQARYAAYRDQLEIVKDNNRELRERHRNVKKTRNHFEITDKSDLNALQTMVTANFHVIDELQALNKIQGERLLHGNHDYIHALSVAEAQRKVEVTRLEEVISRARPTRSFRWSGLKANGFGGSPP